MLELGDMEVVDDDSPEFSGTFWLAAMALYEEERARGDGRWEKQEFQLASIG